jgi:uncharacterized membrane protein
MLNGESEKDQINLNIAAVQEFYDREDEKLTASQRLLEGISAFVGRPAFVGISLLFVVSWIVADSILLMLGYPEFDEAPFFGLQGIVGLCALLIGTVVLTKQNRLARLTEQRANLDLKVTLLTEQKAAKLIDLIEELRRDLPNVQNRHDPDAANLQHAMNPSLVLAALDEYPGPPGSTRDKPLSGTQGLTSPDKLMS